MLKFIIKCELPLVGVCVFVSIWASGYLGVVWSISGFIFITVLFIFSSLASEPLQGKMCV